MLEFNLLPEHVRKGNVQKGEILPQLPYFFQAIAERNGCNANDVIVLYPGDEILLHGHKSNENEIYIIFKADRTTEVQLCPRDKKHSLKNDSKCIWLILAIKIDGKVIFSQV